MYALSDDFKWFVQPGAYRRMIAVGEQGVPAPSASIGVFPGDTVEQAPVRCYAPTNHSGLFRIFSETVPTPDEIVRFADRFGLLLSARTTLTMRKDRRDPRGQKVVDVLAHHVEPEKLWKTEIVAMHYAIEVWQMLEEGNATGLNRCIRWQWDDAGVCAVVFDSHSGMPTTSPVPSDRQLIECIASRDTDPDLLARFTPGNPLLPAKYWLRGVINQRLRGHVEFCFNLDSAHQIVPSLMPDHLLTTLWVQFSLAVALHKKYRRCSACQDWFEMSPEVARSNRKFCSIACKNRTFRARVDQARKLHGEGRGLREIAKTLKTKVAVIKTWIGTTSREK